MDSIDRGQNESMDAASPLRQTTPNGPANRRGEISNSNFIIAKAVKYTRGRSKKIKKQLSSSQAEDKSLRAKSTLFQTSKTQRHILENNLTIPKSELAPSGEEEVGFFNSQRRPSRSLGQNPEEQQHKKIGETTEISRNEDRENTVDESFG